MKLNVAAPYSKVRYGSVMSKAGLKRHAYDGSGGLTLCGAWVGREPDVLGDFEDVQMSQACQRCAEKVSRLDEVPA